MTKLRTVINYRVVFGYFGGRGHIPNLLSNLEIC